MPINFDLPQTIAKPAVRLDIISIHLTDVDLRVKLNWLDEDGAIVRSGHLNLTGQDFTDVITEKVTAGNVDKRVSRVMKKVIMQKVKAMLTIQGTVTD